MAAGRNSKANRRGFIRLTDDMERYLDEQSGAVKRQADWLAGCGETDER